MQAVDQIVDCLCQHINKESKMQLVLGFIILCTSDFISHWISPTLFRLLGASKNNINKHKVLPKPSNFRNKARQFEALLDDRKSTLADENDIYMLETHGYDKYRFLSKSFIMRNKLMKKK